jgi:hypothetical protein
VDRAAAAVLLKQAPEVKEPVRHNRELLTRAVEHLAAQGIGFFLDLGCGLPALQNVYEIAAGRTPQAPVACSHLSSDGLERRHIAAIDGSRRSTRDRGESKISRRRATHRRV